MKTPLCNPKTGRGNTRSSGQATKGAALFVFILLMAATSFTLQAQTSPATYQTPGTYIFTAPANVGRITVEAWGGGGRGGRVTTGAAGGGGGGGAYSSMKVPVTPGATYIVVVGAGGTNIQVNGSESSWEDPALGKLVRAGGGLGVPDNNPSGGLGGTALAGDPETMFGGGNGAGGDGTPNTGYGGGGGSSAGNTTAGISATDRIGATAPAGGGNGGNGGLFVTGTAGNPGVAGTAPGGGGGGGRRHTNWRTANPMAGGNGANGKVVLSWQTCPEITFSVTKKDIDCFESETETTLGGITISANGGAAPYLFSVDNGTTWQPEPEFTGLTEGIYRIRVMDNNGCISGNVPLP